MPSSFWARQLAKGAPKPPEPSRPISQPWWSAQGPSGPSQAPPEPPADAGQQVILPEHLNLRKFGSLKDTERCPGCGGTSYMTVNGADPRAHFAVRRCFECGYPVQQTTSGLSSISGGGPSTSARQVSQMTVTDGQGHVLGTTRAASGLGGISNYNPQNTSAGSIS